MVASMGHRSGRTAAGAVVAALLLIAPLAGCALEGGEPSPADSTSEDDGGNDVPLPPSPDPTEDPVIAAPIKVPPFGGDEEFSPNTAGRLEELLTERCEDGTLCVNLVYTVIPPDADKYGEGCYTTSIEPNGDAISRDSTIAVEVTCEDQGDNGGETGEENSNGETNETETDGG